MFLVFSNYYLGLFTLPEWRKTNGGIPANHNHTFGFVSIGSANVIVSSSFCDPLEPGIHDLLYFQCIKLILRLEPSLFQVSTLQALSAGLLEGIYPIGLLKKHGDFGLGTYAGINGEMIVLDGHYYHAYADGHVEEADDSELTPFAVVVAFKAQSSFNITTPSSLAELSTLIASIVPTDNFFYAIKLHGHFSSVTTRAIPFMNRPYPTLTEALEFQVVVTSGNLDGTAVVIRGPQYTANLNVAGDHFHFISDDHHFGGHALSLTMAEGTLEVQQIRKFTVWLPDSQDFREGDLPK